MISLTKGTISLYVKFVGYPVWLSGIGFPHPPLRGPPSPKGRLTDTDILRSGLPIFAFIKIKLAYGSGGSPRKADGYRSNLKRDMGKTKNFVAVFLL